MNSQQLCLRLGLRGREVRLAGGAGELLRQVVEQSPAAATRRARALKVVLLERVPPLLDGGGGEGGAVRVRDLLALGDRLRGEGERAIAVTDSPVQGDTAGGLQQSFAVFFL